MNPWPYYPPDYGDPNLLTQDTYLLWASRNKGQLATTLAGVGEREPYPWQDEDTPSVSEKRAALLEKVSLSVGLLGGVLGLILTWRELRKK